MFKKQNLKTKERVKKVIERDIGRKKSKTNAKNRKKKEVRLVRPCVRQKFPI